MSKKKVLWFANRQMSDEEMNGLTEVIKEPIVLTEFFRDVKSAHSIKDIIRANDVIVISKAPQFMSEVLNIVKGQTVLRPTSEPTGSKRPPYRKFTGYKKLNRVTVIIDEEDLK